MSFSMRAFLRALDPTSPRSYADKVQAMRAHERACGVRDDQRRAFLRPEFKRPDFQRSTFGKGKR